MSSMWSEDNGLRLASGVIETVDGDRGTVRIQSFDAGVDTFGPCSLPAGAAEGDACLVAFDENDLAWIVSAGGGGGAITDQVSDVQADVDAVTASVLAGLGGKKFRAGVGTLTWPGGTGFTNPVAVPHGLGVTPTTMVATAQLAPGTSLCLVSYVSVDSTNVTWRGFAADTSLPAAATTKPFTWVVSV